MENRNNAARPVPFQLDEFYLDLGEDGQISFLEKSEITKRPFPGLRPFKTSEFQLFHGRDGQAEQLVVRLKKNHFLAVIGSSGTGKSSLIRAGLIPQLLGGYLYGAGTNWNIAICRPGKDPVKNLAVALARVKTRTHNPEIISEAAKPVEARIGNTLYGLLEINEEMNPPGRPDPEKHNLLIIVDQFEELFRFNRDDLGKPNIEGHFVDLLLKASADPNGSIYVIITMRSEFLGDSAKYRGLPEAINEGQYLVPQLSREQIKEVIEDPIKLAGKEITPGLVELLVNEIEESKAKKDLDQLPVLQHTLMRTYREAAKNDEVREIVYGHYEACGGMENALTLHAEAKYKELGDGVNKESFKQKIAKIVFQALTDASTDQKGGRRPTDVKTLYAIAASLKAKEEEVNKVIDHFRAADTSFIMPGLHTPLYPDLILDISHESLMRQWKRLSDWVKEEAEYGKILLRLSESLALYKQNKKDYLTGKELIPIAEWYHSFHPQPAWAERYASDHKEAFAYLEDSERAWKKRRRNAWFLSIAGILAVTAGLYWWNYTRQQNQIKDELQKQHYLNRSQTALDNNNLLAASLFYAEALELTGKEDTLRNRSNSFLPVFYLSNVFKNKSDVEEAAFSPDSDSLLLWNEKQTCYIWNTKNNRFIDSVVGIPKVQLSDQERERIVSAIKQLYEYWGVDATGKGPIINNDLEVIVRVPGNIGSIYSGRLSPDGRLLLTWGQSRDKAYEACLWNMEKNGKQIGPSMLHSAPIYAGTFNHDGTLFITWDEENTNTIRLYKKINFNDNNHGDKDIPAKLYKLQTQVVTGTKLNEQKNGIQCIPVEEWQDLAKDWMREAEAHYKDCDSQDYNYWRRCFPSKAMRSLK